MPYRDPNAERMAARERQRRYRARQRAAKPKAPVVALPGPAPADPVGELASWAAATLVVPPGIRWPGKRWRSLASPRTSCAPDGARTRARCASQGRIPRAQSARCSRLATWWGRCGRRAGAVRRVSQQRESRRIAEPSRGDRRGVRARCQGPPRAVSRPDRERDRQRLKSERGSNGRPRIRLRFGDRR